MHGYIDIDVDVGKADIFIANHASMEQLRELYESSCLITYKSLTATNFLVLFSDFFPMPAFIA